MTVALPVQTLPAHANGYRLYAQAFAQAARPRHRLTLPEWSDAHRMLSAKASSEPGRWRTSRTPFLREIMDCLSAASTVQSVVLKKAAQVGGTEVGLNWIGYTIEHDQAPMLVVVPTLEVRKRWVRQRLGPLLTETPEIAAIFDGRRSRDATNAEDIKDFPGGMLVLGGANSPASLASMPIKRTLLDDVDRFPWEVGEEGDPIGLIRERQKTFTDRKELLVSTPTIKDASRIDEEYEDSDQREYHVPCPHCGDGLVLKWANLRWNKTLTRAWYICEHCGVEIDEHYKPAMLAAGRWIARHPERSARKRGYHINGLYSPIGLGFSWLELAQTWQRCHDDPPKLKRFINTTLGESWEDRSRDVKPHVLLERAEAYRVRTAPPGCLLLTAGVDTQDDRLSIQILGWGRGETCWVIDWLELPGNPARAELWLMLAELLTTPVTNAYGRELPIQATAIDSGGHHTHDVYWFTRGTDLPPGRRPRRLMAIKGANTPSKPVLATRPTPVDVNRRGRVLKHGAAVWTVGVDTAKHVLTGRLFADGGVEPGARRVRFAGDLPPEYYDQLTSEAFDPEKNRWVKRRGRRNEGLDTWVYGYAAAQHPELRVHTMRKRDWDRLAAQLEPDTEKPAATDAGPDDHTPAASPKPPHKRRPRGRGFVKNWRR